MSQLALLGYEAGATLYVYPVGASLADWTTYRVVMTEGTGDDTGRYIATVDPNVSTKWVAFVGSSQPAGWANALIGVGFDLSAVVAAEEVGKVPRAIEAIAAGDPVRKVNQRNQYIDETIQKKVS